MFTCWMPGPYHSTIGQSYHADFCTSGTTEWETVIIDYGDNTQQTTIYLQGTLCQNPPCNGIPCPGTPCYLYPDKTWTHTWTLPGTYTITIYLYPTTQPINEPSTMMSFTMNMADIVRSGGGGICCMHPV